jgi:stringent starvation protein B
MTKSSPTDEHGTSTRPYLIRGLHEWCTDNGFTPYIAVFVTAAVQVPVEYVKNNEIVLNIGFEATSGLKMGNEFIEFRARFGGVTREIIVPVDHVVAIYARENGQGMAFPAPMPDHGESVPGVANETGRASGLRLATASDGVEAADEDQIAAPSSEAEARAADGEDAADAAPQAESAEGDSPQPEPPAPPPTRPVLKRIK